MGAGLTAGERRGKRERADPAAVVELRRYRLRPGMRDALIGLFEREFVETQEAEGMQVIGQFRDLDEPDSFVWLRGFRDMASRAEALARFYTGPVWAAHRDRANETMINSDNVLLLRPAWPGSGFAPAVRTRPPPGASSAPPGLVVATVCSLAPSTAEAFIEFFAQTVKPCLAKASARVLAALTTETAQNTFPRLPVREGETAFVWFSGFADQAAYEAHLSALRRSRTWAQAAVPEMDRRSWRSEVSRLEPTARSLVQG